MMERRKRRNKSCDIDGGIKSAVIIFCTQLFLLSSCIVPNGVDDSWRCDPRILQAGEARVRRIPCSDELIDGGEGQKGDWLLENSDVRFIIRDVPMALTQLGTAGGSIIDVSEPNGEDGIIELLPRFDGAFLSTAVIEPLFSDSPGLLIKGELPDGSIAEIELYLPPDTSSLVVHGPDTWLGVLPPESLILKGSIELARDSAPYLMIPDGSISSDGNWVILHEPQSIVFGHRNEAIAEAWPSASWKDGLSDGEWVELRQNSETVARLAVTDGAYSGPIPSEITQLVSVEEGYSDGTPISPNDAAFVERGTLGQVRVQVHTEQGRPLPASLYWNAQAFSIPLGGGIIATGPGNGEAWISAGPGYEAQRFEALSPEENTELKVDLRAAITGAWLLQLGVPSWPDARSNLTATHLTSNLASQGVHFAVLVANDEVASGGNPPHLQDHIISIGGSQADSEMGQPFAWPWSPSIKRPAHGAAPWPLLEPLDLLRALEKNGSRWTVVDPEWVEHAPPAWAWEPKPLALQIDSLEDLPTVFELADQTIPIRVVGPQTWVEKPHDDVTLSESEIMAQLISGAITATNGPQIRLRVEGQAPGSTVELESPIRSSELNPPLGTPLDVSLEIQAPEWMPVRHAAIVGPGGEILRQWTVASSSSPRLNVETTIPPRAWVAAICWGDESNPPLQPGPPWALSGIVWIGRP